MPGALLTKRACRIRPKRAKTRIFGNWTGSKTVIAMRGSQRRLFRQSETSCRLTTSTRRLMLCRAEVPKRDGASIQPQHQAGALGSQSHRLLSGNPARTQVRHNSKASFFSMTWPSACVPWAGGPRGDHQQSGIQRHGFGPHARDSSVFSVRWPQGEGGVLDFWNPDR